MSVTFFGNQHRARRMVEEPCLCSQMVEGWMRGATAAELQAGADPDCALCGGLGIEKAERDESPFVNWCNENARALHALLRLPGEWLGGECDIHTARRAVIRARNTANLPTRAADREFAPPRRRGDVIDARPIRVFSPEFTETDALARVDQFARFVEDVAAQGATLISWG